MSVLGDALFVLGVGVWRLCADLRRRRRDTVYRAAAGRLAMLRGGGDGGSIEDIASGMLPNEDIDRLLRDE